MFLQETFVLYDCLITDKGTQNDHNSNWSTNTGFSWSDTACTITASTSLFPRITTRITGDFEAQFYAYMSNSIRLAMYNADSTSQQLFSVANETTDTLYKVRRVNGVFAFSKSSDDGATWTNMSINSQSASLTTENLLFGFVISTSTSRSITFHDLKIYPV